MKIVKRAADLLALRKSGKINWWLFDHVLKYFKQLKNAFSTDDNWFSDNVGLSSSNNISANEKDFSLEEHGYIVLLEPKDDVRDLKEIGLHSSNQGLLGSNPENVEVEKLSDNSLIYKISLLCNNEFIRSLNLILF